MKTRDENGGELPSDEPEVPDRTYREMYVLVLKELFGAPICPLAAYLPNLEVVQLAGPREIGPSTEELEDSCRSTNVVVSTIERPEYPAWPNHP